MRKWAATSVVALLVILALPLAAAATGGGSAPASGATCPFPEGDGVVVVISDQLMLAWQEDRSMAGPVAVGLDPGTYAVELVSYDDHSNKSHQSQLREQWYLEGWDGDGNVVFRTGPTADLAESLDIEAFAVGTVEVTKAVVQVKAFHAAYLDPSEPHSVAPLCARFLPGGESSTSIVPSSTTSSSVASSTTSSSVASSTTSSSTTSSSTTSSSTTSSSVASSTTSSSVASSTTSSSTTPTSVSTSATAVTTAALSTTTSSTTSSTTDGAAAGGSSTTETVLSEALEGTRAQSLQELPITGIELEVAFVAIVSVMLGVLLVRRARSWQARLDRRAARIWRRPGG